MATTQEKVRPRAEFLANLPTLAVETSEGDDGVAEYARGLGITFRHELKLVRGGFRYWLVTQGVGADVQAPDFARQGYVLMEPVEADENGECEQIPYGPDDTTWLQALDYFQALHEDLDRLTAEQDASFTHDREAQIQATQREAEMVASRLDASR